MYRNSEKSKNKKLVNKFEHIFDLLLALTILATKSVLNGSSVASGRLFGSHRAISLSSLYATCSAFSRRRLSSLSSFVSTLVGGGVSFGSCKKKTMRSSKYFLSKIKLFSPQTDRGNFQHLINHLFSSREQVCQEVASMEWDLAAQITPEDLEEETVSFFSRLHELN